LFTFLLGLDLLSLLGLDLLSLLEVGLLSLQVFLFYKKACLLSKTQSIELLSYQRIFSQILYGVLSFFLAYWLVLSFWVEDEDASPCRIKDAALLLVTLVFCYVSYHFCS
jgi:hypothetical protein